MKKQKKRILVVDDLASDTELLKSYFQERHDYNCCPGPAREGKMSLQMQMWLPGQI